MSLTYPSADIGSYQKTRHVKKHETSILHISKMKFIFCRQRLHTRVAEGSNGRQKRDISTIFRQNGVRRICIAIGRRDGSRPQRLLFAQRHGRQARLPGQNRQSNECLQSRVPKALYQAEEIATCQQTCAVEEEGKFIYHCVKKTFK